MARKLKIDNGGKVWAPYSPGITVRDHIWLAGQIGIEGGEDIVSQTSEALKKIDNLLEIANSSRDDLVMVTILLTDIGNYSNVNEVYGKWLGESMPPARAAYEVSKLPGDALIEIICEAFRGSGNN
ncbi:MAG: RidA family protein [Candidatus Thalassarchaeaceae archaeon]|jgi:2-iminobutanoate/2-iminopropanoate deaminase|uniref:Endoribonuclease L-PSP (TdcF) n=1 Tax=uncultured Poseidoniia archaeon TaxID=1697135 RepID=A0A1B1TA00_9ARCH|nr:endoribonuclease L-PSP (tdcF) [uncultured Candidatus Thalassoarchaea sp.]|tara:strand:- start:150 stop:527 length:378 start_codon:yes stop_codon:yes gene_type:complete